MNSLSLSIAKPSAGATQTKMGCAGSKKATRPEAGSIRSEDSGSVRRYGSSTSSNRIEASTVAARRPSLSPPESVMSSSKLASAGLTPFRAESRQRAPGSSTDESTTQESRRGDGVRARKVPDLSADAPIEPLRDAPRPGEGPSSRGAQGSHVSASGRLRNERETGSPIVSALLAAPSQSGDRLSDICMTPPSSTKGRFSGPPGDTHTLAGAKASPRSADKTASLVSARARSQGRSAASSKRSPFKRSPADPVKSLFSSGSSSSNDSSRERDLQAALRMLPSGWGGHTGELETKHSRSGTGPGGPPGGAAKASGMSVRASPPNSNRAASSSAKAESMPQPYWCLVVEKRQGSDSSEKSARASDGAESTGSTSARPAAPIVLQAKDIEAVRKRLAELYPNHEKPERFASIPGSQGGAARASSSSTQASAASRGSSSSSQSGARTRPKPGGDDRLPRSGGDASDLRQRGEVRKERERKREVKRVG